MLCPSNQDSTEDSVWSIQQEVVENLVMTSFFWTRQSQRFKISDGCETAVCRYFENIIR